MSAKNPEPDWATFLHDAARAFRLGMEASGNEHLTRFIDALNPILRAQPPAVIHQFAAALNESLTAQSRQDFSYLADLLEYRIHPLLKPTETQTQ